MTHNNTDNNYTNDNNREKMSITLGSSHYCVSHSLGPVNYIGGSQ